MQSEKLTELLHQYFELGVAEGREGRNHDTEAGDAQRVLSEIEAEIAALSTDAEPVATVAKMGVGGVRVLMPHPPGSTQHLPVGTKLYAAPVKTAPAVAVKALKWEVGKNVNPTHKADFYTIEGEYRQGYALHKAGLPGVTWYASLEEAKAAAQADYESRILSALSAQVQDVAEGWQLVPKEPTEEMHNAARDWAVKKYGLGIGFDGSDGCYRAMLAAAPASPASKHGDAE